MSVLVTPLCGNKTKYVTTMVLNSIITTTKYIRTVAACTVMHRHAPACTITMHRSRCACLASSASLYPPRPLSPAAPCSQRPWTPA